MKSIKLILTLLFLGFISNLSAAIPEPNAIWDKNFNSYELTRFNDIGYTLYDWNTIHGKRYSSVSITTDTSGLMFHSTNGFGTVTIIIEYSNLQYASLKRVLFTTLVGDSYNTTRVGVRIGSQGTLRGIWGTTDWENAVNVEEGSLLTSGVMAFVYSGKLGTFLYNGSSITNLTQVWKCESLKSAGDTDNNLLRACSIGGYGNISGVAGYEATKGLTISKLAIFTRVLSLDEMKSYIFPSDIKYTGYYFIIP